MSYATMAEFKRYVGITASETTDDTLLQECLTRASKTLDSKTHRMFQAAADSTRYFDADADVDGRTLYVDRDLCAITSITNGDGTTVTSAQYVTEPRNDTPYYAIRLRDSVDIVWEPDDDGDYENAITVVGRWAWSVTPPDDIVEATLELAKFYVDQRKIEATDLSRPIIAGSATILPSAMPATVRDVIASYRRKLVR